MGGPLYNGLIDNAGKHEHRFPYYRDGDTALTCVDCGQVVFIAPRLPMDYTNVVDIVFNKAYPLPWLLIQVATRPHYVDLAIKYDLKSIGKMRW